MTTSDRSSLRALMDREPTHASRGEGLKVPGVGERLVVIGGDAGGMVAASQARRLRPDLDIVALEMGEITSYSACGIPYLVGREVGSIEELVAREPREYRERLRIDVRLRHEAMMIDLDRREVEVRDHAHDRTIRLGFDHLMLGLGARPRRPRLPGIDHPMVHGVQNLEDAKDLIGDMERREVAAVVVIGGGYIGMEMAEACRRLGLTTTLLDQAPEVMGTLDPDMGSLVNQALRNAGIEVRTSTQVEGIGDGLVHTSEGDIAADLVILGLGVMPNVAIAEDAGIELGAQGAIAVDRRQQTSAAGVWAAGDCAQSYHLVSQRDVYVALGTVANKQAFVAGTNIAGSYATFPGVVGTAISRICGTEVARTGLTEIEATQAGFGFHAVTVTGPTRASYYPGAESVVVKMVAERGGGRVLGAQIVGGQGAGKRIDTVATALHAGMTVRELTQLDLAYAPSLSPLWDPVQMAARKAMASLEEDG